MPLSRLAALLALVLPALIALPAGAQWSTDPLVNTAIADLSGSQVVPKISASPDGGCYIAWFDNSSGGYQVRLQRFDAAGEEQWPHNGIVVSAQPQSTSLVDWDILADSTGACVVTFTDIRDGGDLDVHAYRVLSDGAQAWGANGLQLSTSGGFEADPRVAELTTGDFIVCWFQESSGGIQAQRISPAGAIQYAAGGIKVGGAPGEVASFCAVAASDAGSYIVSFVRDVSSFLAPRHVHVQKFSAAGAPQWGSTPVVAYDLNSVPIAYDPLLGSDGAGGAIVVWHAATGALFNSRVQHIDAAGFEQFPHNGVTVSTDTTRTHIDPAFAHHPATGDTFIFWNERNSGQSQWGIFGQKVDLAGVRQWGPGGIVVLPVDSTLEFAPRVLATDDGAMVFVVDDQTATSGQHRVLGFRYDGFGQSIWSPPFTGQPLLVSTAPSTKSRLPVARAADGGALLIWEDDRAGTVDVYGQRVNVDGTLGGGVGPSAPEFIRGHCNADSGFDIADAIFLLGVLFPVPTGGPPPIPDCPDACDCNDDGSLDIADAICLLNGLFASPAVPPVAPFPDCGPDPTDGDVLDCGASTAACP